MRGRSRGCAWRGHRGPCRGCRQTAYLHCIRLNAPEAARSGLAARDRLDSRGSITLHVLHNDLELGLSPLVRFNSLATAMAPRVHACGNAQDARIQIRCRFYHVSASHIYASCRGIRHDGVVHLELRISFTRHFYCAAIQIDSCSSASPRISSTESSSCFISMLTFADGRVDFFRFSSARDCSATFYLSSCIRPHRNGTPELAVVCGKGFKQRTEPPAEPRAGQAVSHPTWLTARSPLPQRSQHAGALVRVVHVRNEAQHLLPCSKRGLRGRAGGGVRRRRLARPQRRRVVALRGRKVLV